VDYRPTVSFCSYIFLPSIFLLKFSFPYSGIFLSFGVTPEVPVTHVSAYTGKRCTMPAIITISCNQVFSVNKWINFGKSAKDLKLSCCSYFFVFFRFVVWVWWFWSICNVFLHKKKQQCFFFYSNVF